MWLEVERTNYHPGVVVSYFIDCVVETWEQKM